MILYLLYYVVYLYIYIYVCLFMCYLWIYMHIYSHSIYIFFLFYYCCYWLHWPIHNKCAINHLSKRSAASQRLEKWNRILGIICLLISILTSIKLYYQKASVRTDAGQMPDRCSFFNTV